MHGGAFDEHASMRCAFAFAVVHARLVRKLLRVMLAAKSWLLSRRHTLVVGSTQSTDTTQEGVLSLWLNVGLVRSGIAVCVC